MSAFGMHGVYWQQTLITHTEYGRPPRHHYILRGTHRPSCAWDSARAVVDRAYGIAHFWAYMQHSQTHRVEARITVDITDGEDALAAIERAVERDGLVFGRVD